MPALETVAGFFRSGDIWTNCKPLANNLHRIRLQA